MEFEGSYDRYRIQTSLAHLPFMLYMLYPSVDFLSLLLKTCLVNSIFQVKPRKKTGFMTTLTGPKHYHVQNGGAKWNTNMTSVDSANQLCVRRKQLHLAVYVASVYSKFESDQRTHKITSGNRSVKCRFKITFQI